MGLFGAVTKYQCPRIAQILASFESNNKISSSPNSTSDGPHFALTKIPSEFWGLLLSDFTSLSSWKFRHFHDIGNHFNRNLAQEHPKDAQGKTLHLFKNISWEQPLAPEDSQPRGKMWLSNSSKIPLVISSSQLQHYCFNLQILIKSKLLINKNT